MFSLLQQIQDGPGVKIGWMTGFIWQKNHVIDYQKYKQFWYGSQLSVFGKVLTQLQKSRKFPQHKLVDTVKFIIDVLRIILVLYILYQAIAMAAQSEVNMFGVYLIIICGVLTLALPFFQKIASCRLRRKTKKLIQQINYQLSPLGLKVCFPKMVKKFCLFLTCCSCYDNLNYQSLQIWEQKQIKS